MSSALEWLGGQPDWLGYVAAGLVFCVGALLGRWSRRTVSINTAGMRADLRRIAEAVEKRGNVT